jgi:hypothetical protein
MEINYEISMGKRKLKEIEETCLKYYKLADERN